VALSLGGVVLAISGYTPWGVAAGILALATIAWRGRWGATVLLPALVTLWVAEFHGTSKKIARYTTLITELQNLKTWWYSLNADKQAVGQLRR
jgi:hypothetical protein